MARRFPTERLSNTGARLSHSGKVLVNELLPGVSLGNFTLLRELKRESSDSESGRAVWLAKDDQQGHELVLKLVRVGQGRDGQDLHRELEWLMALAHEHLPRVYSAGVDSSANWSWIAMEYVNGATLDRALQESGFESTANLLWQACRALDFLHQGHQVVHGDLKPLNILVEQRDGRAKLKLIDLGLSGRLGEGKFGVVRGTPYYAAASILRGERPTISSDLFSLGISFVEAVTGDRDGISRLDELLPLELARVVRRLALQDEDTRYSSAREVMRDLRELVPVEVRREASAFVRPRFVGRAAELIWAGRWLNELREGTSPTSVVMVGGQPGIGKSRFLEEVGRRASLAEMEVVRLSSHIVQENPYSALISILDALAVHEKRSDAVSLFVGLKTRLHKAGETSEIIETPEFRDAALWLELLGALDTAANKSSILIVIDDVDTAPPVLFDFLRFVARNTKSALVGFLLADSAAVPETVWRSERGSRLLELDRISQAESIQLIESILGTELWGDEHCDAIADATDGHPQFCVAAATAALTEALKERPDLTRLLREKLPKTLANAFALQLHTLTSEEREVVDRFSVLDRSTPVSVFNALVCDLPDAENTLRSLVQSGVLERVDLALKVLDVAKLRYGFSSEALRRQVLESLGSDRRSELSACACQAWQESEESGARTLALTTLGIGAASTDLATEFAPHALEHLVAARSFRKAIELGRQALALTEAATSGESLARIREPIGDAHFGLGEFQAALDLHSDSLDFARGSRVTARLLRKRAFARDNLGDTEGAFQDLLKAHEQNAYEDLDGRRAISKYLGMVAYRLGQPLDAERWLWRAFDGVQDPEHDERTASVWNNLGGIAMYRNRLEEAERYFERALRSRERSGDIGGLTRTLNSLGALAMIGGRLKDAREYFNRALEIKRRLGNRSSIALTLSNLAQLDHWVGSYGQAIHNYEEALAIRIEVKDLAGEVTTRAHLSEVWRVKGELSDALEQAHRAAQKSKGRHDIGRVNALFALGSIQLVLGDFELATSVAEEGLEVARACEAAADEALLLALLGEVLSMRHPEDCEAPAHIAEAEAIARRIVNPSVLAAVLVTRAECSVSHGRNEDAEQAAEEAQTLAQKLELRFLTARAELVLGRLANARGDLAVASRRLHRAEEYALLFASPELTWQVYLALGDFHRKEGREQRSFQWLRKCLGVLEAVVDGLRTEELSKSYLGSPHRSRALAVIETWLGV